MGRLFHNARLIKHIFQPAVRIFDGVLFKGKQCPKAIHFKKIYINQYNCKIIFCLFDAVVMFEFKGYGCYM